MWNRSINLFMVMPMMNQINYEMHRFIKSRKNWIVLALLLVLLFAMNFTSYEKARAHHAQTVQWHYSKGKMADSWFGFLVKFAPKYLDALEMDEALLEIQKKYYERETQILFTLHMYYKGDSPDYYKTIFETEIKRYQQMIETLDEGKIAPDAILDKDMDRQRLINEILLRETVLEKDLAPMVNPYTMTATNAMVQFLKGDYLLVFLMLIGLLTMDVYLSEMEEGSYKTAFTHPVARWKILMAKLVVCTVVSTFLLLATASIHYLVSYVITGPGNWQYPMVTQSNLFSIIRSHENVEPIIITTGEYVALGMFSLILSTLFMVSFIVLASVLTDSGRATLGLSVLLLVVAFITGNFIPSHFLIHRFYPFAYVYLDHVIKMTHSSLYGVGLMISGCGILILSALSIFVFNRKDFLGAKD